MKMVQTTVHAATVIPFPKSKDKVEDNLFIHMVTRSLDSTGDDGGKVIGGIVRIDDPKFKSLTRTSSANAMALYTRLIKDYVNPTRKTAKVARLKALGLREASESEMRKVRLTEKDILRSNRLDIE